MAELHPSLNETKSVLARLRKNKSEATNIDAKENLNLKAPGDCAQFIRHVAALANSGQSSYLLIGVEDKTWILKGLPDGSPLRSVDATQQQMNQVLAYRIDPRMTVCYVTHELEGLLIGVVRVSGNNPPYIISIGETRFGGQKSKGEESFIYNGVVYTRQGTDSVPINRQSNLAAIFNGKPDRVELAMALVFIAALVGAGVGVGTSLIKFSDPYIAALLGGIWGLLMGWGFNKRFTDALGKFRQGILSSVTQNIVGPIWGLFIGTYLGYSIINSNLLGKLKIVDPITMGITGLILASGFTLVGLIMNLLIGLVYGAVKGARQ